MEEVESIMLIEFIEMFLGAYYNFIPDDYPLRDYFTSIIVVLALAVASVGAILVTVVSINAAYKVFRK